MINIIIKDNGFKLYAKLMQVKNDWELLVKNTFDNIKEIEYFYFGDTLIMATVRLDNGHYGNFNITVRRISFNGHTCTREEGKKFESCTWNDELYNGELYK